MRTLVTGGAGFIGSTLVDRLLAEGHEVDVLDDLSSGSLSNLADARADRTHRLTFHQIDVLAEHVVDLIAIRAPEVVFHLAGRPGVRRSVLHPVDDATALALCAPAGPASPSAPQTTNAPTTWLRWTIASPFLSGVPLGHLDAASLRAPPAPERPSAGERVLDHGFPVVILLRLARAVLVRPQGEEEGAGQAAAKPGEK